MNYKINQDCPENSADIHLCNEPLCHRCLVNPADAGTIARLIEDIRGGELEFGEAFEGFVPRLADGIAIKAMNHIPAGCAAFVGGPGMSSWFP